MDRYSVVPRGKMFQLMDGETCPMVIVTEAEANIIAFALNAIANGNKLESIKWYPNGSRGGKEQYTGSTQGVLK